MVKDFIEYLGDFTLIELLGFAEILEVEQTDEAETFLENLVEAFGSQPKHTRKKLLELAKEISKDNRGRGKN